MRELYGFEKIDGKLADLLDDMTPEEEQAFMDHWIYGTPSSTLAKILTEEGYPISETTIKAQRRKNKIGT